MSTTNEAASSFPTTILSQISPGARGRLFFMSLLAAAVGIAAGIAAYLLYSMIRLVSNVVFFQTWTMADLPPSQNHLGLWILPIPIVGAVIVGLMAKYGSPKIRGHGLPEAIEAVLFKESRIQPRVALLKPTSVAIAIGTGCPFGAEGPIIQTGGALGSIFGQTLHVTTMERKMLLASGAAAGMAATFSTPLAAVMLAIELLLFEYKARSFIPLVIASTVATSVRFMLLGHGAMFTMGPDVTNFNFPDAIPWYLPMGVLCGFAAVGYSRLLYKVEDWFEELKCDPIWWTVIGCAVLGIIGYFVPRVLGIGYDTLTDMLNGRLGLEMLAIILLAKGTAVVVTLGSGHSGGLLAPTFTLGAALGGLYAQIIDYFIPAAHLSPSAFALVGMAALFGAAARAPFTFIIFAFELTRDYDAVLPLMLVMAIAHFVALLFMKNSILTEKLARRGLRVHQEYEVDVFQQVSVGSAMDVKPTLLDADLTIGEVAKRLTAGDPAIVRHQAFLLTSKAGELAGIITRGDIVRAFERDRTGTLSLVEAGCANPVVAYADESLSEALNRMLSRNCGRLPVVTRGNPKKIVGYLGRAAILEARLRRMREDQEAQPGWLKTTLKAKIP